MFKIDVVPPSATIFPKHPQKNSVKTTNLHVKWVGTSLSSSLVVTPPAGDHKDLDHAALSIAELSLRLQLPRWGGKSALGLDGDGHDVEVPGRGGGAWRWINERWLRLV